MYHSAAWLPFAVCWQLRPSRPLGESPTAHRQPLIWCSQEFRPHHQPEEDGCALTPPPHTHTHTISSFFRILSRWWKHSHSLRLSTKIEVYRTVIVPTLLHGAKTWISVGNRSGYWSGFIKAAFAPSLAFNGKTTCRTKKSSREPACPALSPSYPWCSCAGLAISQGWKRHACPKLSSSASSKKESAIVALQESFTKINWNDSLHRRESSISQGSRRPQTETAGAHQWEKTVASSRQRGMKPQRKNAGGRKKWASSLSSPTQTSVYLKCSRACASRISLCSHQRACKNWTSSFPKILVCKEWASIMSRVVYSRRYMSGIVTCRPASPGCPCQLSIVSASSSKFRGWWHAYSDSQFSEKSSGEYVWLLLLHFQSGRCGIIVCIVLEDGYPMSTFKT